MLGLNSGITVYLKHILEFVTTDHLVLCQTLFFVSFICWTTLLLLGVLFRSMYQSRHNTQVLTS